MASLLAFRQAVSSAAQYGLGEPCSGGFHGVSTVSGCSVAESAVATAAVCFGGAFEAATGYFAADQAYSAASRTFAAAQTQLAEAVAASSIALAGVVAQKTIGEFYSMNVLIDFEIYSENIKKK